MPVSTLLREMDLIEIHHWMAFHKIEAEKLEKDSKDKAPDTKVNQSVNSGKVDVDSMSPDQMMAMWGVSVK